MATSRESIGVFCSAAIVFFFAVTAFTPSASATDVFSGGSIQAAINVATPGEIITVHDGTYYENLVVNKSDIVIRSVNGPTVTIISSNQTNMHVVNITDQRNVTLEGFTIQNANGLAVGIYMKNTRDSKIINNYIVNISGPCGIKIEHSSDNNSFTDTYINNIEASWIEGINVLLSNDNTFDSTIIEDVAGNRSFGIHLEGAHNNSFADTGISAVKGNFSACGILFEDSDNNTFDLTIIKNVTAATYDAHGVLLTSSENNELYALTISDLTASSVTSYGVKIVRSSVDNLISGDAISQGEGPVINYGVYMENSMRNVIQKIKIIECDFGVYIYDKFCSNTISGCSISRTGMGIYLNDTSDNTITENEIKDNGHGIWLEKSDNNTIERNMIVNNKALWVSGAVLDNESDYNELHENCFYYNGFELHQASDDGSQNNLDRNYWEPPPGLAFGDPYLITGIAMNRDHDPLAFCPLCAVEVPALTPIGLIALLSLLAAIAAVALVRKRR